MVTRQVRILLLDTLKPELLLILRNLEFEFGWRICTNNDVTSPRRHAQSHQFVNDKIVTTFQDCDDRRTLEHSLSLIRGRRTCSSEVTMGASALTSDWSSLGVKATVRCSRPRGSCCRDSKDVCPLLLIARHLPVSRRLPGEGCRGTSGLKLVAAAATKPGCGGGSFSTPPMRPDQLYFCHLQNSIGLVGPTTPICCQQS